MDIRFSSYRSPYAWLLLAAAMTLLLGACKKTNGGGPGEQTLQQYFAGSKQYSLFNRALQRTHLDALLSGADPYTVFAVDDSAMSLAGYSASGIDSANIATLTGVLLYHLVPGTIASTDVELYQETFLKTADSNYQAYLEFNNFGLFYNGIPLVSIDNKLANGLVQEIQTMARPPLGDLATTIAKTPGLNDFSYVVSLGTVQYISGTPASPITIFIPDDSVFVSQGVDSYSAVLQKIQYGGLPRAFMTQGQFFTSDFIGKNIVQEYEGIFRDQSQLWFSADGSTFVEYTGYSSPSTPYRIVQSNIVATNGVIHIIEPN